MIVFSQVHDLSAFINLQNVAIRMPDEGLSTQRTFVKYLLKSLPSTLLHFKLSFLPRIDTTLLTSIATKLPDLRTLELTCTERLIDDCCWDCLEEASTCTIHSPMPDIYCNAEDLCVSTFILAKDVYLLSCSTHLELLCLHSPNWNTSILASSFPSSTSSTSTSTTVGIQLSKSPLDPPLWGRLAEDPIPVPNAMPPSRREFARQSSTSAHSLLGFCLLSRLSAGVLTLLKTTRETTATP